jgi:hypothetical protein
MNIIKLTVMKLTCKENTLTCSRPSQVMVSGGSLSDTAAASEVSMVPVSVPDGAVPDVSAS